MILITSILENCYATSDVMINYDVFTRLMYSVGLSWKYSLKHLVK